MPDLASVHICSADDFAGACGDQSQLQKVAAVEGQALDAFGVDDGTDGIRLCLNQCHLLARDGDNRRHLADFKGKVDCRDLADLDSNVLYFLRVKAVLCSLQCIVAGRNISAYTNRF